MHVAGGADDGGALYGGLDTLALTEGRDDGDLGTCGLGRSGLPRPGRRLGRGGVEAVAAGIRTVGDSSTWTIPLDVTGVQLRPALTPTSQVFTWDPVIHNSWELRYGRTKMHAHYEPIVSTRFRYSYLATGEELFRAMSRFLMDKAPLFAPAEKEDWAW